MNDEDKLMDDWTKGIDKNHLFSDQIQDDEAFTFEEPDIGLDDLTLDHPQKGLDKIDSKVLGKESPKVSPELRSTGAPEILNIAKEGKTNVSLESENPLDSSEKDRMLSLISRYGIQAARELYIKGMQDGKKESGR